MRVTSLLESLSHRNRTLSAIEEIERKKLLFYFLYMTFLDNHSFILDSDLQGLFFFVTSMNASVL